MAAYERWHVIIGGKARRAQGALTIIVEVVLLGATAHATAAVATTTIISTIGAKSR